MRLVDKWLIHVRSQGTSIPTSPPVSFVVDNIARDYYHDYRDWFDGTAFPYAIPPWKSCFVEWMEPPTRRINGTVESIDCNTGGGRTTIGALVTEIAGRSAVSAAADFFESSTQALGGSTDHLATIRSASRGFMACPVAEASGIVTAWPAMLFVFTDADGLPLSWSTMCNPGFAVAPEQQDAVTDLARTMYHILCFAFTFANCKNSELVDSTCELKPRDKIERRLKLPSFKRYTLKIDGRSATRTDGNANLDAPAYHLCRGHFATYTPDRPLFGRLSGRFWIPAHTRGKKSSGEISKDYTT